MQSEHQLLQRTRKLSKEILNEQYQYSAAWSGCFEMGNSRPGSAVAHVLKACEFFSALAAGTRSASADRGEQMKATESLFGDELPAPPPAAEAAAPSDPARLGQVRVIRPNREQIELRPMNLESLL
ncbi:MAG: hypothetical protein ING52_13415, partial [Burkholderiales bacterium]|nr:hypothetical protein [Burkholderiales bacterium]